LSRVDFFSKVYTNCLIQRETGIFSADVNQLFSEAAHSPLTSLEVKNDWSTSPFPIRLHDVHKDKFTFTSTATFLSHSQFLQSGNR